MRLMLSVFGWTIKFDYEFLAIFEFFCDLCVLFLKNKPPPPTAYR